MKSYAFLFFVSTFVWVQICTPVRAHNDLNKETLIIHDDYELQGHNTALIVFMCCAFEKIGFYFDTTEHLFVYPTTQGIIDLGKFRVLKSVIYHSEHTQLKYVPTGCIISDMSTYSESPDELLSLFRAQNIIPHSTKKPFGMWINNFFITLLESLITSP